MTHYGKNMSLMFKISLNINNAYSMIKVSILSDPNRIKNYCKVKTVALEEESKKCWGFGATLYQDLQRKVNQKPL